MCDAKHLDDLKQELDALAKQGETDFQRIAEVAAAIAKREPGIVRFSTDAAMIHRLGRELVAKQETALAELVKNAYDADATICTVRVDDDYGGSMQIIDDGNGMSRADIESGFMRLANDVKVRNPVSPKYHRSRAGRKGIGRFATERLGRRLTIITQTESEPHGWTLAIDWSAFGKGGDLNMIANPIVESPKEKPYGTRLVIEGLNDVWSDPDLRRVFRYLLTLLKPSYEQGQGEGSGSFAVQMQRGNVDVGNPRTVANIESEILGRAVAVIEAKIDDVGNATWWFSSNRVGLPSDAEPVSLGRTGPVPCKFARSVELKAYYFIQSSDFLGHSTSAIHDFLQEHGGISLYRNGYRVPPYGDQYDDWLRLDYKKTTFAPITSRTFLGYVAVTDVGGTMFEETSSREGLIENEAFREVRDVMSWSLEAAVRRIESARGKGRRRKSRDASAGERAANEAEAAARQIEQVLSNPSVAAAVTLADQAHLRTALDRVKEATAATAEVARERDDLLKEVSLLRILASMGLTIAEFTHDFSHLAQTLELNANQIRRDAETSRETLEMSLARFEGQFRQVRAYTAHFSNMITSNASRDLLPIDLYDFVRAFKNDMTVLERRGFAITVEQPAEYDIYTTKMHPSEWSSILLNLLTNSIKAVNRAQRTGKIHLRVGKEGMDSVFLEFSDNGDGIPAANRERIFDAFFTTTGGAVAGAPDSVQAVGTGLGLKIVADIVQSVGGRAEVVDPPKGYVTTVRITVPASEPEPASKGTA